MALYAISLSDLTTRTYNAIRIGGHRTSLQPALSTGCGGVLGVCFSALSRLFRDVTERRFFAFTALRAIFSGREKSACVWDQGNS